MSLTYERKRDLLLALSEEVNRKALDGNSKFNPRRVRDNLLYKYILIPDSDIEFETIQYIQSDNVSFIVNNLFNRLITDDYFKKTFLSQDLPAVNEYQIVKYCNQKNIAYPSSIKWKELMCKFFLYHYTQNFNSEAQELLNASQTKKETKTMNPDSTASKELNQSHKVFNVVKTEVVHTVNNKRVDEMSKQDLFDCALTLENSIKQLHSLTTKSKEVKKEVKRQKKTLKKVIKYLDSKD